MLQLVLIQYNVCTEELNDADCSVQANATSKLQVPTAEPHSLERPATEPPAGHVKNVSQSLGDTTWSLSNHDVSPHQSSISTPGHDKVEGIVWVEAKHEVVCIAPHSRHPSHYHTKPLRNNDQHSTSSCNRCGESLTGNVGCIKAWKRKYHKDCFTCLVSIS
jgi:hypothetical protein